MLGCRVGAISCKQDKTLRNYIHLPLSTTTTEVVTDQLPTITTTDYYTTLPMIDNSAYGLRDGKSTTRFENNSLRINVPSNFLRINANERFTIQFYMKYSPLSNAAIGICGLVTSINRYLLFRLIPLGNGFTINETYNADLSSYFTADTWYHISITRDLNSQSVKLYVDETFKKEIPVPNSVIINDGGYLSVGMAYPSQGFTGNISDFIFMKGTAQISKIFV